MKNNVVELFPKNKVFYIEDYKYIGSMIDGSELYQRYDDGHLLCILPTEDVILNFESIINEEIERIINKENNDE